MQRGLLLFFVFIFFIGNNFAQTHISGTVVDVTTNNPIPNVAVFFSKSDTMIFTGEMGDFNIVTKNLDFDIILKHLAFQKVDSGMKYQCTGVNPAFCNITLYMEPINNLFQTVTITASRVENTSPVTITNISGIELNKNNFGEDMPFLLESTPSAVVTSDAGNGVGYTGIRIRGSDATRVNISINGVPYNDAESQQTYWVDLPDFASSVDDIQIQRGVGTSTYGISSLGASINIFTNKLEVKPYAKLNTSVGSFNLLKTSAAFGTGKIKEHWYFEGRASKVDADGFIDRSHADLASFFITTAFASEKYASELNVFSGEEHTYQSWGGVPAEILDTNRTYNPYTYKDQTDNYVQTHYQWHHHFYLNYYSKIDLTFNYTKGSGYYEQLEEEQSFEDYGASPFVLNTDTVFATDMITQKWLDNDYLGAYLQYSKEFNEQVHLNTGAAYYYLNGNHFGKIIWAEYASPFGYDYSWYDNDATKKDGNIFAQLTADIQRFKFFADVQVRQVNYAFLGADQYGNSVQQNVDLLFFNPKMGITWLHHKNANAYIYFGKSGKEPNRDDFVESSPLSRPSPEILYNAELGERLQFKGWQLMANFYYMYYRDQLILTGQINDVGAYTRTNVPESYRTGIEVAWSKLFFNKLSWNANTSLSKNIINSYTEYVDNWDDGSQKPFEYEGTQIAFSPSVIAYSNLNYILLQKQNEKKRSEQHLDIALISKFVGKQFADNTENNERVIDPYLLNDIKLSYAIKCVSINELYISFITQNVLNQEYESNAWIYRYITDNVENQMVGYYPQAGRNWVLQLSIVF